MNANAAMVEYKQWEGLEKGKERMIRDGQNLKLIEQCGLNEIKVSDALVRANYARSSVMDKVSRDRQYSTELQTRKKENEVLHKKTLAYKQEMHEKQREFEATVHDAQNKRHPFNAKINKMCLENALKANEAREAQFTQDFDYLGAMDYGEADCDIDAKLHGEM
jgi:hypothetical protein